MKPTPSLLLNQWAESRGLTCRSVEKRDLFISIARGELNFGSTWGESLCVKQGNFDLLPYCERVVQRGPLNEEQMFPGAFFLRRTKLCCPLNNRST